ncbi:uncharacterized protein ATNIH1004_001922 [Aspergillus tanneri]|uniref:Rhodopsin domain-containing protein n=1 Tax=Aspergillus tanneri TaxID=1220188 RepID=A0A5M9MEN9_9EURO|nr:uncharacterized protein ATNIH1004_001922 [Aspergillus tanneri]KAA8641457.1 hypothetical protein ATNIH1004_001922 [Aspergillus tanneri]
MPPFNLVARANPAEESTIESWTLYAVGVAATVLRTYSRARTVGFRHLQADDYLVWVGILFYTAQTALAYSVGNAAHGLANNSMTDAQRAALSPDDAEYRFRVIGSKIQLAGWTTYSALIWSLKLSVLAFYVRLTEGLGRSYRMRIYIGFALVLGTFVASIIAVLASCRPFHKYWQINPNPGSMSPLSTSLISLLTSLLLDVCQPAVSKPIVWVSFAANVSTDIYLIFIPLPMLWQSKLRLLKKIASSIILGSGIFVLVCATLKTAFVLVDEDNGAQQAGAWGTRETFVMLITTNLPMMFHLFRSWLALLFGRPFNSSQKTSKSPYGFRSIGGGGGGGDSSSRNRRGPPTANPITVNMTFTESEERMMDGVKMQTLKEYPQPIAEPVSPTGIVVSNEVEVTHESRSSHTSKQELRDVREAW